MLHFWHFSWFYSVDESEDTVACSIYDFLGSIFKVGRSVSTLVSLAQKVLGSEGNGTEHLLGELIDVQKLSSSIAKVKKFAL